MSVGRKLGSLGLAFLAGVFLSAFASMVATSTGTSIRSGWLAAIVLAVTVVGFFPIHHLVWQRSSRAAVAHSRQEEAAAGHPRIEGER